MTAKNDLDIEIAKRLVQKEVEEVVFKKEIVGVVLKADTLGSLEAMIKLLTEEKIPIRKAEVGHVTKQDVVEVQNVSEDVRKVILAFNVKVLEDAGNMAKDLKIEIFKNNIIYRLIDEYKEWCFKAKEREIEKKLEKVVRPAKVKILPGFVFRVSKPCVFGVEVLGGLLKTGTLMRKKDGKIVDNVKEIQKEGEIIREANVGDKVALSMEGPTMGKQIQEGDILISVLSKDDMRILSEVLDRISESERDLLKELR